MAGRLPSSCCSAANTGLTLPSSLSPLLLSLPHECTNSLTLRKVLNKIKTSSRPISHLRSLSEFSPCATGTAVRQLLSVGPWTAPARVKLGLKTHAAADTRNRPAASAGEEKAKESSRAEGRRLSITKLLREGALWGRGWAAGSTVATGPAWPRCGQVEVLCHEHGEGGRGPAGPRERGGCAHHGVVVAVGVGVAVLLVPLVVLLLLQGRGFRLRHILRGEAHARQPGQQSPRPRPP